MKMNILILSVLLVGAILIAIEGNRRTHEARLRLQEASRQSDAAQASFERQMRHMACSRDPALRGLAAELSYTCGD